MESNDSAILPMSLNQHCPRQMLINLRNTTLYTNTDKILTSLMVHLQL